MESPFLTPHLQPITDSGMSLLPPAQGHLDLQRASVPPRGSSCLDAWSLFGLLSSATGKII